MIGGGGEKKTLRLVAQYGDACNVFGSPEGIARKYRILDEHCAAVGRDPAEIERSTLQDVNLSRESGRRAESAAQVVDRFGDLADAGAEHIIVSVPEVHDPAPDRRVGGGDPGTEGAVAAEPGPRLHTLGGYRKGDTISVMK